MNILEHTTEFKRKIKAEGGDEKTAEVYGSHMTSFMVFYKAKYNSPLHITFRDMEDYIIHLRDRKLSASYINQFIAAAKRFYGHHGQTQKCAKLVYQVNEFKTPNVLTYAECMAMCNADIYIKHKAMINLLYYGALRRSEVLNLKIEHISKDNKLTIVDTKFGKSRVIPIPGDLMELLRKYYKECTPKIYLFNGEHGKDGIFKPKYSEASLKNVVSETARKAGIHKKVTPKLLRASRATILLDNGASYGFVSEFLGHENMQTTHDYYHRLTIKGMQTMFEDIDLKLKQA